MICEINNMIEYLDEFFNNSHKEFTVGGIAGTQIEKFVLDAALQTTVFDKILVLNGCQDYIGLMKNPMPNVKFWGDLFIDQTVDPFIPYDPWKPKILNPREEYVKRIDVQELVKYDVIIIFNAHYIDDDVLKAFSDNFSGKIVYVIDPIEAKDIIHSRLGFRTNTPIVVDHLEKVSPMIALARASIGFDSRAVDYKVRGTLTETNKINKKTIGKIDDKQYITNNFDIYREVYDKYLDLPIRKNQRLIVRDNIVDVMFADNHRKATLVRDSMIVVDNMNTRPLMKMRVYNSKTIYSVDVTYMDGMMKPKNAITVEPGNILYAYDRNFIKHRYNHTVMILGSNELSKAARYALLKNSNNVTIVNRFK